MKGFISVSSKSTSYNRIMESVLDFKIDNYNDCYIKEGYGAYMTTLPVKNEIEVANCLSLPYYQKFISKGYEIVTGPPAIDEITHKTIKGIGLYCRNYQEILDNRQKKKR